MALLIAQRTGIVVRSPRNSDSDKTTALRRFSPLGEVEWVPFDPWTSHGDAWLALESWRREATLSRSWGVVSERGSFEVVLYIDGSPEWNVECDNFCHAACMVLTDMEVDE